MSIAINRRNAAPAGEKPPSLFENLPEDLVPLVLKYLTVKDGYKLACLKKSFYKRTIDAVKKNHKEYLLSLIQKFLNSFTFLPEEYRKHVSTQKASILDKKFSKELPLKKLLEESRKFGLAITGKYFLAGHNNAKNSPLNLFHFFDDRPLENRSFFIPHLERIDESLLSLGQWILTKLPQEPLTSCGGKLIALAEQEEISESSRQLYLNLISGSWHMLQLEGIRVFHLIDRIQDAEKRSQALTLFIAYCNYRDASIRDFLRTEEFFSRLPPQVAITHLMKMKVGHRHAIACLDKILLSPNREKREHEFFHFFIYFCSCLIRREAEAPARELFCDKIAELTRSLANEPIFRVLKGIMQKPLDNWDSLQHRWHTISLSDFILEVLLIHLNQQLREKLITPSAGVEITYQIMNQIKKHIWFNNRALNVLNPFMIAAKWAQEPAESSRLLTVALNEASSLVSREHSFFLAGIFSMGLNSLPRNCVIDINFYHNQIAEAIKRLDNPQLVQNHLIPTIPVFHRQLNPLLHIYLMAHLVKSSFPSGANKNEAIALLFAQKRMLPYQNSQIMATLFSLIPEINDEEMRRSLIFSLSEKEMALVMQCNKAIFSEETLLNFIQTTPWQDARDFLREKCLYAIMQVPQKGPLFPKLCAMIENIPKRTAAFELWKQRKGFLLSLPHKELFESIFQKKFSAEEILPVVLTHLQGPQQNDSLLILLHAGLLSCSQNHEALEAFSTFFRQSLGQRKLDTFIAQTLLNNPSCFGYKMSFQLQVKWLQYIEEEEMRKVGIETLLDHLPEELKSPALSPPDIAFFIETFSLKGEEVKKIIPALKARGGEPFNQLAQELELRFFSEGRENN